MTRVLFIAAALLLISACDPVPGYLADGGHNELGCFNSTNVFAVRVVDAVGNPVSGATVTGFNPSLNQTLTGTTDGAGVSYAVTEAIGAGDVQISAVLDTKHSKLFATQWTCNHCDCIATPNSATLTLQ